MVLVTRDVASGNVYRQDAEPQGVSAGDIWSDTNANLVYRRNDLNTDWNVIGSDTVVSATEYGYLNGVTSAIQTQLDTKISTYTDTIVFGTGRRASADALVHINIFGAVIDTSADAEGMRTYFKDAMTLTKLWVNVTATSTTVTADTFSLRRNDGDAGTTISVPAATTGEFEATQTTALAASGNYHFTRSRANAQSITFSISCKVTL